MLENVAISIWERGIEQSLPFSEVTNGVMIKEVTGLGPVPAQFVTHQKVGAAGVTYNSQNIGARNIVFKLGLSIFKGAPIEDSRNFVYSLFPIGEEIELVFTSGEKKRLILGRVESAEPEIFSKEPTMQVSVMCEEPYFKAYPNAGFNTILPTDNTPYTFHYDGQVNTGYIIEMTVNYQDVYRTMGTTTFIQTTFGFETLGFVINEFEIQRISGGKLRTGDVLRISTVRGDKYATLIRNGVEYNVIGAFTGPDNLGYFIKESQWPELKVGRDSTFTYSATNLFGSDLSVKLSWDVLIEGL